MLFVLICTEGEVSEPVCIDAFLTSISTQSPRSGDEFAEVIPVPLKSNHGFKVLVDRANKAIEKLENDKDSLLHLATVEGEATKEKWLVCDYDQMDELNISFDDFAKAVKDSGYELVMNKPNFEYFVLAILAGWDVANKTNKSNFVGEINRSIDKLNAENKRTKGFSDALMIPHYDKSRRVAEKFFGMLFSYNQELLLNLMAQDVPDNERCSDMPTLIERLRRLYSV